MTLSTDKLIQYLIFIRLRSIVIIIQLDMQKTPFFNPRKDENVVLSTEALEKLSKEYDATNPSKNILWSTDYHAELPIRVKHTGVSSLPPETLIEAFIKTVEQYPNRQALSHKIGDIWYTRSYREYFDEVIAFGKALISSGLYLKAVNIIGFNAPEWNISFFGSIFARCLPVGIYTTNHQTVCQYIARHSECKLVISQNYEYASKYFNLLKDNIIETIVIYGENKIKGDDFNGRIILWKDFLSRGNKVEDKLIYRRMNECKPGHCCTLVYTSGTTGMPKGVMLSHDNYTWTKRSVSARRKKDGGSLRMVSYLPLSHVAAQLQDIVGSALDGMHVCFAQPSALQGISLIETLKQVRPNIFFSVPRVWEKIYEKMLDIARTNGKIATKIATWAKSIGPEGTIKDMDDKPTSFEYKLAKFLVYNNVRKALGLDQAKYLIFGAAPLAPDIREYFMSLGMSLINGYGMSECSGPQTISDVPPQTYPREYLREAGTTLPGTDLKIVKQNQNDPDGQICYRGRNVFMGYYKNEEQTKKTIDIDGFLHSGDSGYLNQNGVLFITGRIKELLITAAGENIPPLQIENTIKEHNPLISNVMLIGDGRKYLTCLITLKTEIGTNNLQITSLPLYKQLGCNAKTSMEASKDPNVIKYIKEGLEKANAKAISRAQKVQNFAVLEEDFTVDSGLLTPTMKLKRKEVFKRYEGIIESMYREAKL